MRNPASHFCAMLLISVLALAGCSPMQETISYPETRKTTQVDTYHGVEVADPYRWLEDDNAPETAAWVEAQNKVTNAYLEKIAFREPLRQRLRTLYDYPKFGQPARRGEVYFSARNSGLQNQNVWFVQKGLDGEATELLDPNMLSPDGTTRLDTFAPSIDGSTSPTRFPMAAPIGR